MTSASRAFPLRNRSAHSWRRSTRFGSVGSGNHNAENSDISAPIAGFHGKVGPGAAILQRFRPVPIAGPVGDEDQERLGLGDGVEQARLPEMPVAQMRLIDEHIGAAQGILDRTLEAQCRSAVGSVIAQKDAQHSSHPQGLLYMNDAYCLTALVPHRERVQDTGLLVTSQRECQPVCNQMARRVAAISKRRCHIPPSTGSFLSTLPKISRRWRSPRASCPYNKRRQKGCRARNIFFRARHAPLPNPQGQRQFVTSGASAAAGGLVFINSSKVEHAL